MTFFSQTIFTLQVSSVPEHAALAVPFQQPDNADSVSLSRKLAPKFLI